MKGKKGKAQNSDVHIVEKLFMEVRKAAFKSVEDLWGAIPEEADLGMVRATDTALRLLTGCGDYTKAMKLLEALYTLAEREPPKDFTACQEYPALSQMYMEEFLVESEQFIFDVGMDEVIDFVLNEEE